MRDESRDQQPVPDGSSLDFGDQSGGGQRLMYGKPPPAQVLAQLPFRGGEG